MSRTNQMICRRMPRRSIGRFASREELVGHVWAIRRQQLYPNLRAIAEACSVTIDVVRTILNSEEGLAAYIEHGLPLGVAEQARA
jgi:hypothetical protein